MWFATVIDRDPRPPDNSSAKNNYNLSTSVYACVNVYVSPSKFVKTAVLRIYT